MSCGTRGPPAPHGHGGRFRHDPGALDLILVSRNLERIADHAMNIAEDVIYIVRAEDVRERGEKEVRKGLRAPGP
jgi:phosphate uptake regulator